MSAFAKVRAVSVMVVLAATLSACSGAPAPSGSPSPTAVALQPADVQDAFTATAAAALERDDLDANVREIIESTVESGEMTFQEYKRGLGFYVDCMADVGVEARMLESSTYGVPTILFGERYQPGTELSDDQYQDLRIECARKTYFPLASVYQAQPSAVDATARRIESYRAALDECLEPHGVTLPDDVTFDELGQAIATVQDSSGVACDLETGFMEHQVFPDDFWD